MGIVVVGLGSMGKRRIRIIKHLYPQISIVGVDKNIERINTCKKDFNIDVTDSLNNLDVASVQCAFICTSPLSHNKIINQCLTNGWHVFTEINLVSDGYRENIQLAKQKDKTLFLSSTPMYRKEIEWIKEKVKSSNKLVNYIYHAGQYLPDWHPWESYKSFFIVDKRTNGCKELFAIELPWIINVFGEIIKFKVIKNKITNLNLNYNDSYLLLLEHKAGHKGTLIIDVVSRKATRNLEVFGENIHVFWEGTPDSLYDFDIDNKEKVSINLYNDVSHDDKYVDNIIEDAYTEEIKEFFDVVEKKKYPKHTFEKDKNIISLINEIEG